VRHTNPTIRAANPNWLSEALAICGDTVRFVAIVFVAIVGEIVFAVGPLWYAVFPGKRK